MNALWQDGRLECGGVVCHAYRRFAQSCFEPEFRLFERWIDRYVENWALCDGVSTYLVAAAIQNAPELRLELPRWTQSKDRWKRRAAAVSLVPAARKGRHVETVLEIAGLLRTDEDDMVRKGLGWMLKDAWPAQPARIGEFLDAHANELPKLVLRIAREKMPRNAAPVVGR